MKVVILEACAIVSLLLGSFLGYIVGYQDAKQRYAPLPGKETVTKEEIRVPENLVDDDMKLLQEALQKSREANDMLKEVARVQADAENALKKAAEVRKESKKLNEETQKMMDEMRKELREFKEEEKKQPKLKFNVPADTVG